MSGNGIDHEKLYRMSELTGDESVMKIFSNNLKNNALLLDFVDCLSTTLGKLDLKIAVGRNV